TYPPFKHSPEQTQLQHYSVLRRSSRQVTNLNGARIFRIVQQPDRAAVFPLQIPEAATHESAQHLHHRFAAELLRLRDQNNKNSTPACK
ncbi:hypothetical protein XENOCAPTIV_020123, partial [Xenoophorus captivus]